MNTRMAEDQGRMADDIQTGMKKRVNRKHPVNPVERPC